MSTEDVLTVLRRREGWSEAVANLRLLAAHSGDDARRTADAYGNVYEGRRGAMVFDVVASRRRKYLKRVVPMVARWEGAVAEPSLLALATTPPAAGDYGLGTAEPLTMQSVARNLLDLASETGLSEDEACRMWARGVDALLHAHTLDPFRYAWNKYRTVKAHPVLKVGTRVCRFGAKTGNGSGCTTVTYVSACIKYTNSGTYCKLAMTKSHTGSKPGDSGGPWYYGNNTYGIHSGSGSRNGKSRNWFDPSRVAVTNNGVSAIYG